MAASVGSKAADRLGKYLAGKSEKPEQAASEIFSWYNGLVYEMALAANYPADRATHEGHWR